MKAKNLTAHIDRIGLEIVGCTDGCAGVRQDQENGYLPRGLLLERPGAAARGCIVIGLNPGKCDEKERRFYKARGATYESVKAHWKQRHKEWDYVNWMRNVLAQVGLHGPVIWSNLAKCENEQARKEVLPLETWRHCAHSFLRRELRAVPLDWLVLALGKDSWVATAYLAAPRTVIGMPHPTGAHSRHDFASLFVDEKPDGLLRDEIKARVLAALGAAKPAVVWIGGKRKKGKRAVAHSA
jgi:hypothetical protein